MCVGCTGLANLELGTYMRAVRHDERCPRVTLLDLRRVVNEIQYCLIINAVNKNTCFF